MTRTNSLLHQSEWNQYQGEAWIGLLLSIPGSVVIARQVSTPAGGTKPQPGFPVFYNASANRYQVPTTAANIKRICGIVIYNKSDVPDSSGTIEYDDDDVVDIVIRGGAWVKSGAALEATDLLTWDNGDKDWVKGARPTITSSTAGDPTDAELNQLITDLSYSPIVNYSPTAVAAGDLVAAYLPGGVL